MESEHLNVFVHLASTEEMRDVKKKMLSLKTLGENIMSALSDFAKAQNEYNEKMDASVSGLQEDIKNLMDSVNKLQNSAGAVTPEDQKSLDEVQAKTKALAEKLEALNSLNPPVVPPAPVGDENKDENA